jgi:hypothetical protein
MMGIVVGQTIAFRRLLPRAFGPRNFMKNMQDSARRVFARPVGQGHALPSRVLIVLSRIVVFSAAEGGFSTLSCDSDLETREDRPRKQVAWAAGQDRQGNGRGKQRHLRHVP